MKSDLKFDVLVNKEKATMTVIKEFAAKRQLVWDCHTKSELLDQWFAPKPWAAQTKSMDFREGGHWLYAMVGPEGQRHWGRMDYQSIRPPESYTLRDSFCDETGKLNPELPSSTWNVSFEDNSDRTVVRNIVTFQSGEDLEKSLTMGMKEGLASALEGLDALLDRLG